MRKIPVVERAWSESDLTHNWFTRILEAANPKDILVQRWEKKNQHGRKDLSLSFEGRERCIIEFKKPSLTDLRSCFEQAHRYGYSSNYWRDGSLIPVLGVLTNGLTAIVFDGSAPLNESLRTAEDFAISNEVGLQKFIKIFKKISQGDLGHKLHKPILTDSREEARNVVEDLSAELLKYFRWFNKEQLKEPFDAMLQMFLVAVLRDCGYIPTRTLQKFYDAGDWNKVSDLLNEMLASNFTRLPHGRDTVVQKVYQETETLCARLDRIPPDCLGMVYESVLHKITGNKATTSYYTPHEMAMTILHELKPTPDEVFLDPSCGSGTFLTSAIEYIVTEHPKMAAPEKLFSYVKNNLRGLDRDAYACQVAKAMVLAAVANQLDFDPSQRELVLPNLKNSVIHADLFLHTPKSRFDVIAGNLPWGHVDGKRKDCVLDPSTRKKMEPLNEYKSFYRNVDVSSIALEHIRELFLKNRGRLGLLVKQQSLYGQDSAKMFIPYAKSAGIKFWDYGQHQWFNNIASLTAVAWVGRNQKQFIENKSDRNESLASSGLNVGRYGSFHLGFQSSADSIYKAAALKKVNVGLVRELYPDNASLGHFLLPRTAEKIVFLPPGTTAPNSFLNSISKEDRQKLKNRKQVADKTPYSWRGAEGCKFYRFDHSQSRIVFQKYFNGIRMRAAIDEAGQRIGISTQVVFIPNKECPSWIPWCLLAWLNSKFLRDELLRLEISFARSNAISISAKKLNSGLKIPQEIVAETFGRWVEKNVKDGATPEMVETKILELIKRKSARTA